MEEPTSLRESVFTVSSYHDATEPQGVSEVDSPPYEHIRSFEDHITQPSETQPTVQPPTTLKTQGSSTYLGAINDAI